MFVFVCYFKSNHRWKWNSDPVIFGTRDGGTNGLITQGVCSTETETLLVMREECAFVLRRERVLIYNTLQFLLASMCNSATVGQLFTEIDPGISRIVPLESVVEFQDAVLSTNLNFGRCAR